MEIEMCPWSIWMEIDSAEAEISLAKDAIIATHDAIEYGAFTAQTYIGTLHLAYETLSRAADKLRKAVEAEGARRKGGKTV